MVGSRWYQVADQSALAATWLVYCDRGGRHTGVPEEHRLDLAQLDPVPTKFYLLVHAAEELQRAVTTLAHVIAGPVHPAAVGRERIGYESLGGEARRHR